MGSSFRTSDAFRVEKIYLCGITAIPPNKEIRKSALGATESVEWEKFENTESVIKKLKSDGYHICAIEQTENTIRLNDFIPPEKPIAVVFGHEVNGVQQSVIDLCNQCIEIPQIGTKHSLNISVSVGIVIWDLYKKIIG